MKLRFLLNAAFCVVWFSISIAYSGKTLNIEKASTTSSDDQKKSGIKGVNALKARRLQPITTQPVTTNLGDDARKSDIDDMTVVQIQPESGQRRPGQGILKRICPTQEAAACMRGSYKYGKSCTGCIPKQCPKCWACTQHINQRFNTPGWRIAGTIACTACFAGMGGINDCGLISAAKYAEAVADGRFMQADGIISPMYNTEYCIPNCTCPCCWPCKETVLGMSPCYFTSILCTALCVFSSAKLLCNKVIEHGKLDSDAENSDSEESI